MIEYREDLKRELEALKKKAEAVFKRSGRGGSIRFPEGAPAGDATTDRAGTVPFTEESFPEHPSRKRKRAGEGVKRPSGRLTELVSGVPVASAGGEFYRVLTGAETIWEDTPVFHRDYLNALADPFQPDSADIEPLLVLKNLRPAEVCYLDLETTGLSMAPLFLVGLMYMEDERLVVDQLFARDYTEEEAVLWYTVELLKRFRVLVTFNGLRFDIPFLKERMTVMGIEFVEPGIHIDLLPLARRIVHERTPNHKLQTLEGFLCRRKRIGDVPGSDIPDVYHEFVRTGDAADIAAVFHHNRLDLLTMVQLVTIFLTSRGAA